jgi:peptidoglycan/LPS O-acetylase OafA/YrhL
MKRIPTLDGWRAVAISAVLIHHVARGFFLREADYDLNITRYGAFGVDIFFGLSGLLITKLLLDEWQRSASFDLRGFYIRRVFRILPLYLAFLAAYTVAGYWRSGWEVASCLLFFRNYVPDALVSGGTQPLWSLSVEEHFYLLWPGLLAWIGARRGRHAALGLAFAFAVWRMIESQLAAPLFPLVPTHFRTDLRLDSLLWGCVFAFLLSDGAECERLRKQLRFPVWIALAGVLGASMVWYSELTSVWVAALIPMLLVGTAMHPHWKLSRVLDFGPVSWLGRISYSLYLWQGLFMPAGWDPHLAWWRVWPWNVVLCLGAATLSYYALEKPLIRVGRRVAEGAARLRSDGPSEFSPSPKTTLSPGSTAPSFPPR